MKSRLSVARAFLYFFLVGTGLFLLPCSTPAGQSGLPFFDALFTAASAVNITGLTVIDPGSQLSLFGQIVLCLLVHVGCVGIMTLGTFFLVCTGRRLSLANEFSISDAYGTQGVKGLKGLVLWVVFSMLAIEALGTVGLHKTAHIPWPEAFFYASMAFCNAGFSLSQSSLGEFAHLPATLATFAALIILGGIGFIVLYNLITIRWWRRNLMKRGRPALHTRIVIYTSLVLTALTFLIILALEWQGVLKSVGPWQDRLSVAFFQSVTPRTCGFTVLPIAEFKDATRFVMELMMFIGAAPGGAGGGIKVTTLVVFLAVIASIYRGRRDVIISKRSLAEDVVRESVLIFFLFGAFVALAMTLLLITEAGNPAIPFENLFFEVVSAVSTTGLSVGETTRLLSIPGRIIIILCMFFGRLGALTLVMFVAGRDEPLAIRYPREDVIVG